MLSRQALAAVGCLLVTLPLSLQTSEADLRKDVLKITLLDRPGPARPGEPYENVMRIQVAENLRLSDFTLTGSGWTVERFDPPSPVDGTGLDVTVPFRGIPVDPGSPLVLEWTRDGERESRALDLSPAAYRGFRPHRLVAHPAGEIPVFSDGAPDYVDVPEELARAWPEVEARMAAGASASAPQAPGAATRVITVNGRLICRHEMTDEVSMSFSTVGAFGVDDQGHTTVFSADSDEADPDGYFSIALNWYWSTDPDVVLLYAARNDAVIVQENDVWEDTWSFSAGPFENVTTSVLDVGVVEPVSTNSHAALYIAETLGRAQEYNRVATGWIAPQVELLWPDSDGSNYSWLHEIHISTEDRWTEHVYLHEYGHHFNQAGFGYYHDHTGEWDYYCNGICDEVLDWALDDCGHCLWCQESGRVAWNEGLPDFLSRFWSNGLENWYDTPATGLDHLSIDTIGDGGCLHDPAETEGYFAAVLWDLVDGMESDHDDPEYDPGVSQWTDATSGWEDEVLDVLDTTCGIYGRRPRYPMEFLRCFIDEFSNYREDIWETFAHNGFDLDEDPPPLPTNFIVSPPTNTPSPDNTIAISWTRPSDDASGVAGYATRWYTTPADPGTSTANIMDVTSEVSIPMAPGTWYYMIRTRDRSGKWSTGYATVGPFLILEPDPVDLEPASLTGWDYPLVPRNDATAGIGDVHLSTSLSGTATNTYWNAAVFNSGDEPSVATSVSLYLGDEPNVLDSFSLGGLGGGVGTHSRNRGPLQIYGGRHVLGMFIDADEVNAEPDEVDNYWASQFVWYPSQLYTTTNTVASSPPPVNGGLDYYSYVTPYYLPCRGYRLEPAFWFSAATMFSTDLTVDYDLTLYDDAYGVETGFDVPDATSGRPPGFLEAVLVNVPNWPYEDSFIGVRNHTIDWSVSNADFNIRGIRPTYVWDSYGVYYGGVNSSKMLELWGFVVDPATGGSLTITLKPDPGAGSPLYMGYFEPGFTMGSLLDADPIVSTTPGDSVTISVPGPFSEMAVVAVWREPGEGAITVLADYSLRFEASPPDPGSYASSRWVAPVVPQPNSSIGSPYTTVGAPSILVGGGSTYVYLSEKNYSPATSPVHEIAVRLDGGPLTSLTTPAELAGNATYKTMAPSAVVVPGGRHTLGMAIDPANSLHEILESNNVTARQWVWRPSMLAWNASEPVTMDVDPLGGRDDLPPRTIAYLNCLGYRMPSVDYHVAPFTVAFLANDGNVDGDLRIHPASSGPTSGFTYPAKSSGLSAGKADFVIVNTVETGGAALDIGLVGITGGGMAVEADACGSAEITDTGRYDGYTMGPLDYVQLHRIRLPLGHDYRFRLVPDGGDLAFSLHRMDEAYSGRLDALEEGDDEGPDGEEEILQDISTTDTHILAVWRPKTRYDTTPVDYQFIISKSLVGIGDDPPAPGERLTLVASPNPFGSSTSFRVETVEDAPLSLVIHDMRGVAVRRVDRGVVPAGSHVVTWDGRDGYGRPVAQGVYFGRMESGSRERVIKVIKVE